MKKEYGESVRLSIWVVISLLRKRARECLGKNKWYEIRFQFPIDYGRNRQVAWYSNPFIKKQIVKPPRRFPDSYPCHHWHSTGKSYWDWPKCRCITKGGYLLFERNITK
jgi:hypothetical protein